MIIIASCRLLDDALPRLLSFSCHWLVYCVFLRFEVLTMRSMACEIEFQEKRGSFGTESISKTDIQIGSLLDGGDIGLKYKSTYKLTLFTK